MHLFSAVRRARPWLLQISTRQSVYTLISLPEENRQGGMLVILAEPRKSGTVVPLCDCLCCITDSPLYKGIPP